jgi:hypothetical protein
VRRSTLSTKEERREWEREWKENDDRRKEDEYNSRPDLFASGAEAYVAPTVPQNPPPKLSQEQQQQLLVDAAKRKEKERDRHSCTWVIIALVVILVVLPIVWAILRIAFAFIFYKP